MPVDDTPVEPGPGQTEAQTMVEDETAEAKELERTIAAAEVSSTGSRCKQQLRRRTIVRHILMKWMQAL